MTPSIKRLIPSNSLTFLVFAILLSFLLVLYPVPEDKLSFRRMLPEWRAVENVLKKELALQCRTLKNPKASVLNTLLIKSLSLHENESGTSCDLNTVERSFTRFQTTTRSEFLVKVTKADSGETVFEKPFSISYPRPLCFLPFFLFFASLFLGNIMWGLGLSFFMFLMLLFNFNFLEAVRNLFHTSELVISTDKNWLGFTLFTFFILLMKQEFRQLYYKRIPLSPPERFLNRFSFGIVGLWNPAFFSYFYCLFQKHTSLKRLSHFFDIQVILATLSLYLFSMKEKLSLEGVFQSLFLPRYFTYAVLFTLLVTYGGNRNYRKVPIWFLPALKQHLLFILAIEVLSYFVKPIAVFPTLTRVSFALLLSQLSRKTKIQWGEFQKDLIQPIAWIFLSSIVTLLSQEYGVVDLALSVFDPTAHPSAVNFFTYLSGLFIGIVTGSFSTAVFALIPALLKSQSNPIVKGALLDGILAGALFSPFSLFTLLPAAFLKIPVQTILLYRIKRLSLPLFIGATVYSLSTINSVAILRPVTFIFLCLLLVVYKLQQNEWKMNKVWPWEIQLPTKVDKSEKV